MRTAGGGTTGSDGRCKAAAAHETYLNAERRRNKVHKVPEWKRAGERHGQ